MVFTDWTVSMQWWIKEEEPNKEFDDDDVKLIYNKECLACNELAKSHCTTEEQLQLRIATAATTATAAAKNKAPKNPLQPKNLHNILFDLTRETEPNKKKQAGTTLPKSNSRTELSRPEILVYLPILGEIPMTTIWIQITI